MNLLEFFKQLFDPHGLQVLLQSWGWLAYLLLFAIIFIETGLFIFFLPGDSLLFAIGAIAADPTSGLNIWIAAVILLVAKPVYSFSGLFLVLLGIPIFFVWSRSHRGVNPE